jgi:hypothetical protein
VVAKELVKAKLHALIEQMKWFGELLAATEDVEVVTEPCLGCVRPV